MATKLFVGSLPYAVDDEKLKEFFAQIGEVASANVIFDRDTGRSKGFGFVEMTSDDDAKKAVDQLNGKELDGRSIVVNEARPREERPRGGGGGGYGGGNRGGGGYNDRRY
ncbi:RNA-binding protein [Candidatus Saccharibacteria bacterium]|nr:RNA-binding protein [Candidatus Saccharibacteria bacterium]